MNTRNKYLLLISIAYQLCVLMLLCLIIYSILFFLEYNFMKLKKYPCLLSYKAFGCFRLFNISTSPCGEERLLGLKEPDHSINYRYIRV